MPGLNRRGPMGFGPMTGRGLGYCGWGCFSGRLTKKEEKELVEEEIDVLEKELEFLKKELEDLK